MIGSDSLKRTFMFFCFASAALLLAVQWWQANAFPQAALQANPFPLLPNRATATNSLSSLATSGAGGGVASAEIDPTLAAPIALNATPLPPIQAAPLRSTNPSLVQSLGQVASAAPALSRLLQPHLVVDLSDRTVSVYQGELAQNHYPIAVGKAGWETPAGTFQVNDKQIDPHWQHPITKRDIGPGPDNPLGSRWIGFWSDGVHVIGFHGTNQTELIGQAVSHGCIRMSNSDIEALFQQVEIGTPVIVQP